jgi:hypothetical protein
MQLLKELTRVWQLDSCYQPGLGLEEWSPTMQLLKELTRVLQLQRCETVIIFYGSGFEKLWL